MPSIRESGGFLLICVGGFLLCAALARGEQTVKKIRLAYDGFGVGTMVAWVGKDAGLFRQHGLDVEDIFIQNRSVGGMQALVGVDVFLGSGNPVLPVQSILKGHDVVFLGSHVNKEQYKFGVSPVIESIRQLKGKKIGVSGLGGRSDLIARVVLRRAGIDPVEQAEMLTVGFSDARAEALSKNLIQGAPLSLAIASEAEKRGIRVLEIKEVPVITELIVTTRSAIKKDDEAMRRFMKGYLAAIHYYLTRPTESIRIMGEHLSGGDPSALKAMYAGFALHLDSSPALNEESVQAVIDAAAVVNQKAKSLAVNDLFDMRLLDELKASGFIKNLYVEKIEL